MATKIFLGAATYIYILGCLFFLASCGQSYNLDDVPAGTNNTPQTAPTGNNPGSNPNGNPSGTPVTGSPHNPTPGTNPDPGPNPVCNPFGDPTDVNPAGPQISGKLYGDIPLKYTTDAQGHKVRVPFQSVNEFFAKDSSGKEMYQYSGTTLFFEDINAPERVFTQGFSTIHGDTLLSPKTNQPLVEFFAMSLESNLKLSSDDAEGTYQLAILSDDGSNLYLNNSSSPSIANDGEHPPVLGCMTTTINMKASTRIPFILDYYQGPRYHIANVFLWRKITPGQSLSDVKCRPNNFYSLSGDQKSNYYVWELGTGGATRTGDYTALLKRGWKPLKATNFIRGANSPTPPASCVK